jgi:hypothetical protein
MPRPFWDPFWDPFWRPFWHPVRTGFPLTAEEPCTERVSDVPLCARQPCALRERIVSVLAWAGARSLLGSLLRSLLRSLLGSRLETSASGFEKPCTSALSSGPAPPDMRGRSDRSPWVSPEMRWRSLASVWDRWSHARPANPDGEEVRR